MELTGAKLDDESVIAAQTATILAANIVSTGRILVKFATADETVAAVKSGEADAVLADAAYLSDFVKASNGDLSFVSDPVAIGGGVGMGVRESDSALKGKMNATISSMKADGTLSAMIAKWFDGRVVKY